MNKNKETLKEQGFYHTKVWRSKREKILRRDHYLCQLRISDRCSRKANTVHHIKDLEDYPELALADSNLTSCCYWCHEMTKEKKEITRVPEVIGGQRVRIIRVSGKTEID